MTTTASHSSSPPGVQAFVISMPRSTDRRSAMQRKLQHSGLQFEFFDAVEGAKIDRAQYPAGRALTNAELGCYLSHVGVWRLVAESPFEGALVLEDDVSVVDDIEALCRELGRLPVQPDMVRVSSLKPPRGPKIFCLDAGRNLLLARINPSGSQGYWLTRAGARRLLDCWATPTRPFDKALDRYWQHGLKVLLLDPPAVWETPGFASTIVQRSSKPQAYLPRKFENARRAWAVRRIRLKLERELQAAAVTAAAPATATA